MTLSATPTLADVAAELGQPAAGFMMDRVDVRTLAQVGTTLGTPFQMSSLAGRTCINYSVTIGTDGGDNFGVERTLDPPFWFGSVSPTTLQGNPVGKITFNRHVSFNGFITWIQGNLPANLYYAAMWRNFVGLSGTLPSSILKVSDAPFNQIIANGSGTLFRQIAWNNAPAGGSNWPALNGQTVIVQITY